MHATCLRCALVLAGLVSVPLAAAAADTAAPAVKQILLLQSLDRGAMALDIFTGDFRAELDQRSGRIVNVAQVVVGPAGFDEPPDAAIVDYLRSAFAQGSRPDLIVTAGGPAAVFARKYRPQLFPETPVLFASVDQRFLDAAPLSASETAVAVALDFPRTIDDIVRLFPQTSQVFVVMGTGQIAKYWRPILEREFGRFQGRIAFTWSDRLSFSETLQRVAQLPPHSVVFYATFGTDSHGGTYADERALADLHAAANVPLFAGLECYLGHGIVGGTMMPVDVLGRRAAEAAVRILNGESPGNIRFPPQLPGPPIFDGRELRRWGVDERQLPPGSIVRFHAPSLWRDHRGQVLSALGVLVVQSLLILGLLYQRRARQRAENDSRRNLALAADSNRRITLSALAGSIAHDLAQPLASIRLNAQAAAKLIDANRAPPETIREILVDITTDNIHAAQIVDRHRTMLQHRALEQKPVDLDIVVRDSLSLLTRDLQTKQIQVTVNLPPVRCLVLGDQVLLQQVLVNLLMNAMEAMGSAPPDRRQLQIVGEMRPHKIELSVSDHGVGLPAKFDGRVFAPFVTTKTNGTGIGLTIAQAIVEAHRGTLTAHNNPEGGATFTITLPASEAP